VTVGAGLANIFSRTDAIDLKTFPPTSSQFSNRAIALSIKPNRQFISRSIFFTLVTCDRQPIFAIPENVSFLRVAIKQVRAEKPFDIVAAVILPEHLHFIWTLPDDDIGYPARIGRLKILLTQALRGKGNLPKNVSLSRRKHRESNVWQRRFWEHTIRDEKDFEISRQGSGQSPHY
jgi:REP element-mobilizing transposase RayT